MLLPITNVPRDYAWGSRDLLAALQGRSASASPEAEVWFGDHPADPADLITGGTLAEVTGGSLPYLLKLLAAADPLSIQVHPTREQARSGFARERGMEAADPTRNYRDENHKPELLVALSDRFEALVGLRPLVDTRRLLASFPDLPAVRSLRGRLSAEDDSTALRDTLAWLLSGRSGAEVAQIVSALDDVQSGEFEETIRALRSIAARNPADPGVVVALLMNFVVLRPGEAVFLRAGLLHAYVRGLGVEIMAASDNVLRGGLTSKHIDVAELLAIVDTAPGPVAVQPSGGSRTQYDVPVDDFALQRLDLDGEQRISVHGPTMVLATAGQVSAATADGVRLPIAVGSAVFASADERELTLRGQGEVFIAEPGRLASDRDTPQWGHEL